MENVLAYPSRSRLRGELLELLIVEIRSANAECKNAAGETDRATASHRLRNALQVFDDLVFPEPVYTRPARIRTTSAAGISLNRPFQESGVLPPAYSGGNARSSMASNARPASNAGASSALRGR